MSESKKLLDDVREIIANQEPLTPLKFAKMLVDDEILATEIAAYLDNKIKDLNNDK